MIVERAYPQTRDALIDLISRSTAEAGSLAVQCGHFLVYYDHTEDLLLPCVREELNSPRHAVIMDSVGMFPFFTWQLGLDILRSAECPRKGILTVVNDWQYLPEHIDRSLFYKSHEDLFGCYASALKITPDVGLITQRSLGFKVKTGVWFSEVSLRNQYGRQVAKLLKNRALPPNMQLHRDGDELSCSLLDAIGNHREIYCTGKRPSCTQEIAELVRQVCFAGQYEALVNIYPLVCKQYVQAGTELFFDLFALGNCRIVNIGLPSTGIRKDEDFVETNEVSVHLPSQDIAQRGRIWQ